MPRIAIDVPIGYGPREADGLARALVGGSSVFSIPERERFEAPFAEGGGISAQAYALGDRIRHVTALAASDGRFREVHPELCFTAMNDMRRLKFRKKSAGGAFERLGAPAQARDQHRPGHARARCDGPARRPARRRRVRVDGGAQGCRLPARPAGAQGRARGRDLVLSGPLPGTGFPARGEPLKRPPAGADEREMSTAFDSSDSRPLDPGGLAARIAPFAGALLVAFAFVNLRHDGGSPGRIIVAAAVASMLVLAVGAVPWRALPGWTQTLPPLAFFVLVAVLVDVDGGSGSSFAPLTLLPVLWLALYGTRGQLLAGILGAISVFLVPIVWLGAPRYPPNEWQTPTMWMITAALVGTVVHELVRDMRLRAAHVEIAASSDELTSLPSRAAWTSGCRRS